jgi:D-alanyl-D-alanine carboxypeptidase
VKVLALALFGILFVDAGEPTPAFRGTIAPVPDPVAMRMRERSWRPGCPAPIADLAYVRVSHLGYDGAVHEGELVVHKDLAREVVALFRTLFELRFPVEKMRLVDDYGGDDDASMADNNTSGFNCRFVMGRPGVFSKHSLGRAIDINPLTNPMVTKDAVFPPAGAAFTDRRKSVAGLLRAGDKVVAAFAHQGWNWGGSWTSMKDYQHFEK